MGILPTANTYSRTWRSDRVQEMERWKAATTAMHFFFKEKASAAPVPWEFCEWLKHRMFVSEAKLEFCRAQLRKQTVKAKSRSFKPPIEAFGGKMPQGNRSSVLAQTTIWCRDWFVAERAGAELWPPQAELKYEGDCRAERNFGRNLPLPRARLVPHAGSQEDEEAMNPDKQRFLQRIAQHPLDNVDWIDRARQDWLGSGHRSLVDDQSSEQIDEAQARHYIGDGLMSHL